MGTAIALIVCLFGHEAGSSADESQYYEKMRDALVSGKKLNRKEQDQLSRETIAPSVWERVKKENPPTIFKIPKKEKIPKDLELTAEELEKHGVKINLEDSQPDPENLGPARGAAAAIPVSKPVAPEIQEPSAIDGTGIPRAVTFPGKKSSPKKK